VEALEAIGHKRLLLLTGEHPKYSFERFLEAVQVVSLFFFSSLLMRGGRRRWRRRRRRRRRKGRKRLRSLRIARP